MNILDPLTGKMHHNVISLEEQRAALREVRERDYRDAVQSAGRKLAKRAVGLRVLVDCDPGDERDVGC